MSPGRLARLAPLAAPAALLGAAAVRFHDVLAGGSVVGRDAVFFFVPLREVTTARLRKLLADKSRELGPKSLNELRAFVHNIFEVAREEGGPWEGRVNPAAAPEQSGVEARAEPKLGMQLGGCVMERYQVQLGIGSQSRHTQRAACCPGKRLVTDSFNPEIRAKLSQESLDLILGQPIRGPF